MKGTGLKKETAAALAYVFGPVTGVLFLILEKDPFVRFHAMQSIVALGGLMVLGWILPLTIILLPLAGLVGIVWFILWLVLIYKAWQGEMFELPIAGKFARDLVKKV